MARSACDSRASCLITYILVDHSLSQTCRYILVLMPVGLCRIPNTKYLVTYWVICILYNTASLWRGEPILLSVFLPSEHKISYSFTIIHSSWSVTKQQQLSYFETVIHGQPGVEVYQRNSLSPFLPWLLTTDWSFGSVMVSWFSIGLGHIYEFFLF